MKKVIQEFWITNISPMNVSLADLNVTIKAYNSINLLDKKHYNYTVEQIKKSIESGSIYKKRNKIKIRKIAPETINPSIPFINEVFIPTRKRSLLNIKEENYEELNISDEEFAKENADIADTD